MDDPKDKDPNDRQSRDLTDEIRRGRKFNLAEAVGRQAGGNLKGASPIAPTVQLTLQIEEILDRHLLDNEGSLRKTIVTQLANNAPLLARHLDDPAGVLLAYLDKVLASQTTLNTLVRLADAKWGQDYDERPRFEKEGQAPAPDDPYTRSGVRALLEKLRHTIST